jgi:hypothetical protein
VSHTDHDCWAPGTDPYAISRDGYELAKFIVANFTITRTQYMTPSLERSLLVLTQAVHKARAIVRKVSNGQASTTKGAV